MSEPDYGRSPGAERAYAMLLALYPRRIRAELEDEYVELFRYRRERWLTSRGRLGPGFWLFIAKDALLSSLRERRAPLDADGRYPVVDKRGGDGMKGWLEDLGYAGRRLRRGL